MASTITCRLLRTTCTALASAFPFLVISPYAKKGYVSHTQYELSSVLKFIEERFGLPALTSRDATANDITDAFDFTQTARSPMILNTRVCPSAGWASTRALSFTSPALGQTSAAQSFTVKATSSVPLTISTVSLTGTNATDFAETDNCKARPCTLAQSCTVNATFTPTASGVRTATISVNDNANNTPQSVALSGDITAVALSPATLTYAHQLLLVKSYAQIVTLTNTSASTKVNVSSITFTGTAPSDYAETDNCVSSSPILPGKNCQISVTFTPAVEGTRTATLNVNDDSAGPQTVAILGNGDPIAVTPSKLSFPTQVVGTSATGNLKMTNLRPAASLQFSGVVFSGTNASDFSETDTCLSAGALPPGGSCTVTVKFTPGAVGSRSAAVTFSYDDGLDLKLINLFGNGTSVQLSTTALAFGSESVGDAETMPVTVTNASTTTALHVTGIAISGVSKSDFTETDNCVSAGSIAPGTSCTINVTFIPSAKGVRSAALSITDDGGSSPQTVALTGTGT